MTEPIISKIFKASATSEEFLKRIRYAAAFDHLCKPSEQELAAQLGMDSDTLAAWKLRPEWDDAVQAIRTKMYFTSPSLRVFIQEMTQDGPRVMQEEAVQTVVDMTFPPRIRREPCN